MVSMKSCKLMIDRDKSIIPTSDPVDYEILEYLYSATINDILKDEDLVKLIDSNGFYKTSFCEAFELDEIIITIDKIDITWYGPPERIPSNLDVFKKLNKKAPNINQTTPLKEY